MNIFDRDLQGFRNKGPESGGIQHPRHPDDPVPWKSTHPMRHVGHHIKRVGDNNENGIRGTFGRLTDYGGHDFGIGFQ